MHTQDSARPWIATACLWLSLCCTPLAAQPVPGEGNQTQPPVPTVENFPRVKLVYYPSRKRELWTHGWKEIEFFDLTEWTLEKDVYLDYGWTDPDKNNRRTAQEQGEAGERDYSLPTPRQRIWRIRYEPAATEGESHLFITGIGGRHGRTRIYGNSDFISFVCMPDTGWYELGMEARFMRYLQQRRSNTVKPLPTRTQ